jgi:chitodextrinase
MRFYAKFAVLVSSIALLATSASAATYYVSTSGNDASAGTMAAPFRTITKGAAVTHPGDIVNVRAGVYNELVRIVATGTAAARITVRSNPGELAIIDGTGFAADKNNVMISSAQYVDLAGFEIRNAPHLGVCTWNASHVGILNNKIHDCVRNGIYVGADSAGLSSDITIDGNDVFHTVLENQYHTMTGGWAQAVGTDLVDGVRITNNRVYENDGNGIGFCMTDNGYGKGNILYDNFSTSFYLDNAQTTTVDGNLIYSTLNSRYFRDGHPAHGIGLANENYSTSNPLNNDTIINNIVINSRWAIFYDNYEQGGGLKNVTIANNTFYSADTAMIYIASDAHSNTVIANNAFYQTGGGKMDQVAGAGLTFRNNSWYGGNASTAASLTDVVGDPRFVNAGGLTAADYKLTSTSPLVQHGSALTGVVTTDYFGTLRPTATDIGASQYTATGATPAGDTQAPTAPTALIASQVTASDIVLTWTPSTDNVGVTGYRVLRGGAVVATVTGTTWTDANAAAPTTHVYQIVAVDAAGNQSAGSNVVTLLNTEWYGSAASQYDDQAPSTPTFLRSTEITTTSATILWNGSTDNVGVTGYQLYRSGTLVSTSTDMYFVDSALTPATAYTYEVFAVDANGNRSAAGPMIRVTTLASKVRAARR